MVFKDGGVWSVCLLLAILTLSIILEALRNYYYGGLNRYPGPLLAKFTDFWHWLDVQSNQHHHHIIHLHRHYGDVVRIGPNKLSISRPDYVPHVYGVSTGFLKSEMYNGFARRSNGKIAHSSLSTQDPKYHMQFRKPIAAAYSLTSLTAYEPLVDGNIAKFISRLGDVSRDSGGGPCNMALWLRLYAHDVILSLTFSSTIGFMDTGADVDDFISKLDANLNKIALLTTMPWTAYWVKHNPIVGFFSKDSHMFANWAVKRIQERIAERQKKQIGTEGSKDRTVDFLDIFLDAARPHDPSAYNFTLLIDWTLVNVMAGADTTAIGLRAVLWFLLKNPSKKEKLLQELQDAKLSVPVSWKQTQQLPYLSACVKEALRLCPAIGLGLERKVPQAGLEMPDGYVLPEGTNVSMNAWVVNRQDVHGKNVDDFIPERWLQQEDESIEQHSDRTTQMKRADLTFGGGSRACMGKYVAFLEIYKVIPAMLLEFDIDLVDQDVDWVTMNRWTVRQNEILCRLKPRMKINKVS